MISICGVCLLCLILRETVGPLVISVSGACFARYPSRAAAEAVFALGMENNTVRIIE
jgi:hypothetical protein